jgi:oligopeptide/dipeptide ABC transporter ATP-binding protein
MSESVAEVTGIRVRYRVGASRLTAVDGVTLRIGGADRLGIIGESGSGKSTLVKALAGLVPLADGRICYANGDQTDPSRRPHPGAGRTAVMFQDPVLALSPRLPAWRSVSEAIEPRRLRATAEAEAKAKALLERVGLAPKLAERRPHALSGGQRRRVSLARALAGQASLLLCDEPVASLDVTAQAELLTVIRDVTAASQLPYVMVSHDLLSVAAACNRVAVMYLGQIVEAGPVGDVLNRPKHPYTRALLAAAPRLDEAQRAWSEMQLPGEVGDPLRPPSGCRFRTRCAFAAPGCAEPQHMEQAAAGHDVACCRWQELDVPSPGSSHAVRIEK